MRVLIITIKTLVDRMEKIKGLIPKKCLNMSDRMFSFTSSIMLKQRKRSTRKMFYIRIRLQNKKKLF